jgi:ribonuclease HI
MENQRRFFLEWIPAVARPMAGWCRSESVFFAVFGVGHVGPALGTGSEPIVSCCTMNGNAPHFVLISEASRCGAECQGEEAEGWRFTLQMANGEDQFVASDTEPGTQSERLELLAVVRGLEALDQPSRVTLVTRSRYVSRGLRAGLPAWRESGWQWERFGKMVPVKNRDLWQRVDQALKFHHVQCRRWRVDAAHRQDDRPTDSVRQMRADRRRSHLTKVSDRRPGERRGQAHRWGGQTQKRASCGTPSGRFQQWWRRLLSRIVVVRSANPTL